MPQPQTKAQVSKDTIHPVLPVHHTVSCRETYRSLAGDITAFKEVMYNHFISKSSTIQSSIKAYYKVVRNIKQRDGTGVCQAHARTSMKIKALPPVM